MNTIFRLYNKDNKTDFTSSFFDLISGEKEPKQTKGLAYIFSQNPDVLEKFIKLIIRRSRKDIKFPREISSIMIEVEPILTSGQRADIILKINVDKKPRLAIIIEAKSIGESHNVEAVTRQVNSYIHIEKDGLLKGYNCIGVVLTKYLKPISELGLVAISWDELINKVLIEAEKKPSKAVDTTLLNQYLKFLTKVNKSMKFYEKEVLSIPAGKTIDLIEKYNIYVCPDNRDYSYKKSLFLSFRAKNGGEMKKLYKIEDILVFNIVDFENSQKNIDLSLGVLERISNYISSYKEQFENNNDSFFTDNMRFYILSENENIELSLKPKPEKNNSKHSYYTLKEILTLDILPRKTAI